MICKKEKTTTKRGFDFEGGIAGATYKELPKLSRVFKDQLAYPLIATAREGISLKVTVAPLSTVIYKSFMWTFT